MTEPTTREERIGIILHSAFYSCASYGVLVFLFGREALCGDALQILLPTLIGLDMTVKTLYYRSSYIATGNLAIEVVNSFIAPIRARALLWYGGKPTSDASGISEGLDEAKKMKAV